MTIRHITTSLALLAASSALTQAGPTAAPPPPGPAPEPTSLWSGSVTLGFDTDYIFRGLHVTDESFTAAIDLNYQISDRLTLNLNAWYLNGSGTGDNYDEVNLYAKLLYKVNDSFSFGPSFRFYDYPFFGGGSQYEPGIEAVFVPCPNTTVNAGLFYETETEAWYAELGVSYVYKINDRFSLVPGALISYLNRDDFSAGPPPSGFDISEFNHAAIYVKAPITLKPNVTLTPYVAWNIPMDAIDDVGGLNNGQDDEVYGGVSLAVGF